MIWGSEEAHFRPEKIRLPTKDKIMKTYDQTPGSTEEAFNINVIWMLVCELRS